MLFPHGVLFRDSESEMRKKMIAADMVDAVIGLEKNLFYNSSYGKLIACLPNEKTEREKRKNNFYQCSE